MSATGPSQMYHVSQYDGPDPREIVAAMLEEAPWLKTYGLGEPCVVGPVNDFGSGTTEDNDPTTGAVYDGEGHGVREAPMPRPR